MRNDINGISDRITIFREYKSLKKSAFAKLIGISRSTLTEIENRKNSTPSTFVIISIANVFNDLNIEWLLTEKGEMVKEYFDNTQNFDIEKITKEIELMNKKQKYETLKFINEKIYISKLENLVKQLAEQNNQ